MNKSIFGEKKPSYENIGRNTSLLSPPKPVTMSDVMDAINRAMSQMMAQMKPSERVIEKQIIREKPQQIVREVYKKDQEAYDLIDKANKDIQRIIDSTPVPGGPGVIGVPIPDNQQGKILKTDGRRIYWDFAANQTDGNTYIPIGDQTQNGSYRLIISGTDLSIQRLESGSWVEKGVFQA